MRRASRCVPVPSSRVSSSVIYHGQERKGERGRERGTNQKKEPKRGAGTLGVVGFVRLTELERQQRNAEQSASAPVLYPVFLSIVILLEQYSVKYARGSRWRSERWRTLRR